MNDFKIEVNPKCSHYNFTIDDVRYILYEDILKGVIIKGDVIWSDVEIISVTYGSSNNIVLGGDYLFIIYYSYKGINRYYYVSYNSVYITSDATKHILKVKEREYKIKSILNE